MKLNRKAIRLKQYSNDVFINCPFDLDYQPMFRALTFAVLACGLRPRCALEVSNAGEVRIERISRIIEQCRWGIHDISRTEPNANGLPRFNMPLELGLFLGARRFGKAEQQDKSCMILDREPYRFQEFISDIAGQDIKAHDNNVGLAIHAVRDWLTTEQTGIRPLPGGARMAIRFEEFMASVPAICEESERRFEELTFSELSDVIGEWLKLGLNAT